MRLLIHHCSCCGAAGLNWVARLLWICSSGLFSLIFLSSRIWWWRLRCVWILFCAHFRGFCERFHTLNNTCLRFLLRSSRTRQPCKHDVITICANSASHPSLHGLRKKNCETSKDYYFPTFRKSAPDTDRGQHLEKSHD